MTGDDTRMLRERALRERALRYLPEGRTMTPDELRILRNALADAAAYRRDLTDACGCDPDNPGPECMASYAAAGEYDDLAQVLARPPSPPLPRADDVTPRDGLL